jgi:hypothetical protein
VDVRPQIEALLDAYANAIEARDVAELKRLYPGMTVVQEQGWRTFFRTVREVRAHLSIASLELSGGTAALTASGSYDYQADGRDQSRPASFHAIAAQTAAGWRFRTIQ